MRVRVNGSVSDLCAAGARYHEKCKSTFMSPRNVQFAKRSSQTTKHEDEALHTVIDYLQKNKEQPSLEKYFQFVTPGP